MIKGDAAYKTLGEFPQVQKLYPTIGNVLKSALYTGMVFVKVNPLVATSG